MRLTNCSLNVTGQMVQQAEARLQHHHSKKLFVFGDSYADTGNTRKDAPGSWKEPYGITFPGEPTGRFSDGRVLTDYVGKCLKFLYAPFNWNTCKDMVVVVLNFLYMNLTHHVCLLWGLGEMINKYNEKCNVTSY